jgi:hypothetical protein
MVLIWAKRSSPTSSSDANCDRTTSAIRGLSPKIISGDPQRSENTQTQHISIQYNDIKVEVKVITVEVPCISLHKLKPKERFKR